MSPPLVATRISQARSVSQSTSADAADKSYQSLESDARSESLAESEVAAEEQQNVQKNSKNDPIRCTACEVKPGESERSLDTKQEEPKPDTAITTPTAYTTVSTPKRSNLPKFRRSLAK